MSKFDDIFENSIKESEQDIRDIFELGSVEDVISDIENKIAAQAGNIEQYSNVSDVKNYDMENIEITHGQLEAIKNVLVDGTISDKIGKEKIDEFKSAITGLETTCEKFENDYKEYENENKAADFEGKYEYYKVEYPVDGFDEKLNYDSLCKLVGIPDNTEAIHRYGTQNAYAKNGVIDKSVEVKFIPATEEGKISPYAVGRINIDNNRELLFVGHVSVDDKNHIQPKLENVTFIGTDGTNDKIPKHMKNEDGCCTSIDLFKGELKPLIPYGNKMDGKIDINASHDSVSVDIIKKVGMQIIDENRVIDNGIIELKNSCTNLASGIDIATKNLEISLAKDMESGAGSFDDLIIKSDTVLKMDTYSKTMSDISKKVNQCADRVGELNETADRLIRCEGDVKSTCAELSIYLKEAMETRNDVYSAFEEYSNFVDLYKTENENGISMENACMEQVKEGVEKYNNSLDKSNTDRYEADCLHIGANGTVYTGLGVDATKRIPSMSNQTCSDDNPELAYICSSDYIIQFPDVGAALYDTKEVSLNEKEVLCSAGCMVEISVVNAEYIQYLTESGMSKEDIVNEMDSLRNKYFGENNTDISGVQLEKQIKGYLNEISDKMGVKQDVVKDKEKDISVDIKVSNDVKWKSLYRKVTDKIESQNKIMGRLGHGDLILIGLNAVQAFTGLMAGEEKYHIKGLNGEEKIGYYSFADVISSTYTILTANPNAIVNAILYRCINYVCTNTIDVVIRNLTQNDNDKVTNDNKGQENKDRIDNNIEGAFEKQIVDNNENNDTVVKEENDNNENKIEEDTDKQADIENPEGQSVDNNMEENLENGQEDFVTDNQEMDIEEDDPVTDEADYAELINMEEYEEDDMEINENIHDFQSDNEPDDIENITNDDKEQDEEKKIEQPEDRDIEKNDLDEQIKVDNSEYNNDITGDGEKDSDKEAEPADNIFKDAEPDNTTLESIIENENPDIDNNLADSPMQPLDNEDVENKTDMAINPETETDIEKTLSVDEKNNLVEDINKVLDGDITIEDAHLSAYLDKNADEAVNIITDTLTDKLDDIELSDKDVVNEVGDFIYNFTNPANYDSGESLEGMIENVSKKSDRENVVDDLYAAAASLANDDTINTKVNEAYDIDKKDNMDDKDDKSFSFEVDGHKFDVDTVDLGSDTEMKVLSMDNSELDPVLIDESLDKIDEAVSGDIPPIVLAGTSDNPVEECINSYIKDNDSISTKDDLVSALEHLKEDLPKILNFVLEPDKAINNIIIGEIETLINNVIAELTGVNCLELLNDIKGEVADKLNDLVSNTTGIDVLQTMDDITSAISDKMHEFVNDILSSHDIEIGAVAEEMTAVEAGVETAGVVAETAEAVEAADVIGVIAAL